MSNRHERHTPSLCVTSAGQSDRHERHTPLGGVTTVTLARLDADLVPMPRLERGPLVAGVPSHSTHTAGLCA